MRPHNGEIPRPERHLVTYFAGRGISPISPNLPGAVSHAVTWRDRCIFELARRGTARSTDTWPARPGGRTPGAVRRDINKVII